MSGEIKPATTESEAVATSDLVRLRLAYNGDYPGYPCAWINDYPINDVETNLLLDIMAVKPRGWPGLRKLFDKLGAKKIPGSLEHEEWEGTLEIVPHRASKPNSDYPHQVSR